MLTKGEAKWTNITGTESGNACSNQVLCNKQAALQELTNTPTGVYDGDYSSEEAADLLNVRAIQGTIR